MIVDFRGIPMGPGNFVAYAGRRSTRGTWGGNSRGGAMLVLCRIEKVDEAVKKNHFGHGPSITLKPWDSKTGVPMAKARNFVTRDLDKIVVLF